MCFPLFFFFCLFAFLPTQLISRENEKGVRSTPNLVKVAKNRPTEVLSPNIAKLSMFIIYYEKEEKLNDLQVSFCQHHGDLDGSRWSVLEFSGNDPRV